MRGGLAEIVGTIKQIVQEFIEDDVMQMAAATAYRLILALPPLVLFFAALSAVVAQATGLDAFAWVRRQVETAPIPQAVRETIQILLDTVEREGNPGLASFGIVLTLWAASGAMDTLILALNRAYDVTDPRPFVKRRLLALALTIGLSLSTITAFVLLIFGQWLGQWVAELAGLGKTFTLVWNIVRWPLIFLFVSVALAVLYSVGPAVPLRFRWFSVGAVLATVGWLLAAWIFGVYLQFADPGSAYGALGTLIVLLFFLFISSVVLLTGAEVNAVLDKRYNREVVREKAAHPDQQTDPAEAQARAAQEHLPPAALGVTAATRRAVRDAEVANTGAERPSPLARTAEGPPGRAATIALTLALVSLFATAFARALRGR